MQRGQGNKTLMGKIFAFILTGTLIPWSLLFAESLQLSSACQDKVEKWGVLKNFQTAIKSQSASERSWKINEIIKIAKSAQADDPCILSTYEQASDDLWNYWNHVAKKYKCFKNTPSKIRDISTDSANKNSCLKKTNDQWKNVTENMDYLKRMDLKFAPLKAKFQNEEISSLSTGHTQEEINKCLKKIAIGPKAQQLSVITDKIVEKIVPECHTVTGENGNCPKEDDTKKAALKKMCLNPYAAICNAKNPAIAANIEAKNTFFDHKENNYVVVHNTKIPPLLRKAEAECQIVYDKKKQIILTDANDLNWPEEKAKAKKEYIKVKIDSLNLQAKHNAKEKCQDHPAYRNCQDIPDVASLAKMKKACFLTYYNDSTTTAFYSDSKLQAKVEKVFKQAKKEMLEMLESSITDPQSKKSMIDLVNTFNTIRFGKIQPDGDWNAYAGIKDNHFVITVDGMALLPEEALKFVIKHEIGHGLSPDRSDRLIAYSNTPSNFVTSFLDKLSLTVPKPESILPIKNHPLENNRKECFSHMQGYPENFSRESIADSIAGLSMVKELIRSNPPTEKRWEQFAQHVGLDCKMHQSPSNLSKLTAMRAAETAEYNTCLAQGKRFCQGHPLNFDRLNNILMANPDLRNFLGCSQFDGNPPSTFWGKNPPPACGIKNFKSNGVSQ